MNEAEFLRRQLAAERQALADAARRTRTALSREARRLEPGAAPATSEAFLGACAAYLLFGIARAAARDAAHLERLRRRCGRTPQGARAGSPAPESASLTARLEEIVRAAEGHRAALEQAWKAACADRRVFDLFKDKLSTCAIFISEILFSCDPQIEASAERHYTIEDWRAVASANADSILEERRLRTAALGAQP